VLAAAAESWDISRGMSHMRSPAEEIEMTLAYAPVEGKAVWKGSAIDYTREGSIISRTPNAEIDAAQAFKQGARPIYTIGRRHSRCRRRQGIEALSRECDSAGLRTAARPAAGALFGGRSRADLFRHLHPSGPPARASHQGGIARSRARCQRSQEAQRGYHKGGSQPFHSDACDVVGLICLRAAKSGGASRLASMPAIHNTLLGERPDLVEAFWHGFPHRRTELDAKFGTGIISPKQNLACSARPPTASGGCFYRGGSLPMYRRTGDVMLEPIVFEASTRRPALRIGAIFLDMNSTTAISQFLNNRLVIFIAAPDYRDPPEIASGGILLRSDCDARLARMPANQVLIPTKIIGLWLRGANLSWNSPSTYVARMTERAGAQRAAAV